MNQLDRHVQHDLIRPLCLPAVCFYSVRQQYVLLLDEIFMVNRKQTKLDGGHHYAVNLLYKASSQTLD